VHLVDHIVTDGGSEDCGEGDGTAHSGGLGVVNGNERSGHDCIGFGVETHGKCLIARILLAAGDGVGFWKFPLFRKRKIPNQINPWKCKFYRPLDFSEPSHNTHYVCSLGEFEPLHSVFVCWGLYAQFRLLS